MLLELWEKMPIFPPKNFTSLHSHQPNSNICFRLALLALNSETIFLISHLRIPTQIGVYYTLNYAISIQVALGFKYG